MEHPYLQIHDSGTITKEEAEQLKALEDGENQSENSLFGLWQDCLTSKLIAAVFACKSFRIQDSRHCSMQGKGFHKSLPLTEELWMIDGLDGVDIGYF